MPFEKCKTCAGNANCVVIVDQFAQRDCGHILCTRCGITHDTNVDDISTKEMTSSDINKITSEKEYRKLFVETSNISKDDKVYPNFKWDDQKELRKGVASHVVSAINKHAAGRSNINILDVGCGNGFTSLELADVFIGATINSLDPSPQVMSIDGYNNQIFAKQGILTSGLYEPETFDVVVIVGNLMLHDDPFSTLDNAIEVLKEGGLLIIDFKNIKSSIRLFCIFLARLKLKKFIPKQLYNRNFVNMRYGFHDAYLIEALSDRSVRLLERTSKPPRLLEFSNKSEYTSGWKGMLWSAFDRVDVYRNQQAWVQMDFRKET